MCRDEGKLRPFPLALGKMRDKPPAVVLASADGRSFVSNDSHMALKSHVAVVTGAGRGTVE